MNSKKTKRLGLFQFFLMAVLFLLTLTMVVPLLHILARSLSDPLRSGGMNGLDILPKGLTFINYQVLFRMCCPPFSIHSSSPWWVRCSTFC